MKRLLVFVNLLIVGTIAHAECEPITKAGSILVNPFQITADEGRLDFTGTPKEYNVIFYRNYKRAEVIYKINGFATAQLNETINNGRRFGKMMYLSANEINLANESIADFCK